MAHVLRMNEDLLPRQVFHCSFLSKNAQQVGCMTRLALAVAGVAQAVQPFLVCDRYPVSTIDPRLGLGNGAVCNDCELAAEEVEGSTSGKAGVTATKTVEGGEGGEVTLHHAGFRV
eukprot:362265-Chlamydomonas_euryale.AAC.19